eukprot:CAMPEP_0168300386 /NCGR_PEP_ID=MMETSP0142_2-20121227/30573_1 /TAXON_ID=44445 /ORGANISM="Pseudo-nitzschia australis, Strain 10249 10 AB" /LENGTH=653 /DNA_ID=CAMNT_0008250371 /DNA_START=20 /DNA_END=1982 /DNA_ORIENTATION=+
MSVHGVALVPVLNRGRIYDCGRVPPIPRRQRSKTGATDDDGPRNCNSHSHPATATASVSGCYAGCFTLIQFLTSSHTNHRRHSFSESGWRRRIERGQIRVDGIVVTDTQAVLTKAKQQVEYYRRPWKESVIRVVAVASASAAAVGVGETGTQEDEIDDESLKILYIDDHLMAVHKPSGLPTMPSQTYFEYSVLNALRQLYGGSLSVGNEDEKECTTKQEIWVVGTGTGTTTNVIASTAVKQLIQSQCSALPQPVHRLGVGTSGILVIATSLLGRQRLTDAIRLKSHNVNANNKIRKTYRALVYAYRRSKLPLRETETKTKSDGVDRVQSPKSTRQTRTRTRTLIPDFMTIDCPIGPVPFPIGGDSIHAACPCDSTSDDAYGHVRLRPSNCVSAEDDGRAALDFPKPLASNAKNGIKPALSHVKVIRRNTKSDNDDDEDEATAVVEVEIPTGRPHQIRIHMSYAGYPLVNDPLYLPGGIPDIRPRQFESRKQEEEDFDTDGENDDEDDDDEENVHVRESVTNAVAPDDRVTQTTTTRVALPRDCGYHLHSYQITLEHPSQSTTTTAPTDSGSDADTAGDTASSMMTFTAALLGFCADDLLAVCCAGFETKENVEVGVKRAFSPFEIRRLGQLMHEYPCHHCLHSGSLRLVFVHL